MKPLACALFCSLTLGVAGEPVSLKLTRTIPLPGVRGRFDHFAADVKGHRLFVAALGNDTLEVVDVAAGKLLQSITGLHKPTGVAYFAGSNEIGVANGDDGAFKVFDGSSYNLVRTIGSLNDADNVRFDAKSGVTCVGYGSGALAILDARTMKLTASIPLMAHPESFQLETSGSRIFVNVPDAKQIAVIDREKQTVTATWPMTKFHANFPMALDEASHRLFVGCRQPARLVVFDTASGQPVADLALSGDMDDLFFDAQNKRLYVSCGEGFVDVVEQSDADTYMMRERIPTRAGARTSFFSAELAEFYLAVPQRGKQEAEIRVFQPPSAR
jgi:DNA-binding beta-propeller fold protein YncE